LRAGHASGPPSDQPATARVPAGERVGGIWDYEGDEAFVIFLKDGDRWLIDGSIDIVEAGTPAAG